MTTNRTVALLCVFGLCSDAAIAQALRLVCENWHPRLGQMNDATFAIDLQLRTCDGSPCKITESEFSWSVAGGRYENVINRLTGEGHTLVPGASGPSEKVASLKNCRTIEK